MHQDIIRGRSVEMVRAELSAIEREATFRVSDEALAAHVRHLRREHAEARVARLREVEAALLDLPTSFRRS
jgi:hypothetical protein